MIPELEEFKSRWSASWDCLPVAHYIRPDKNWRRLHSLPDSKRYPEDEGEYQEILRRQKTILDELRKGENSLVLFKWIFVDEDSYKDSSEYRRLRSEGLELFREMTSEEKAVEEYEDHEGIVALASLIDLNSFDLEAQIRSCADDIDRFLIMDKNATWLFAPYDGGVDFFALDESLTEGVFRAHSDWKSYREDML